MSQEVVWDRNNSHYVAIVDRRSRTRKNLRQKAKCVRELDDNLRVSYEISTRSVREKLRPLWTASCGEIFKTFAAKSLKKPIAQCQEYFIDLLFILLCTYKLVFKDFRM